MQLRFILLSVWDRFLNPGSTDPFGLPHVPKSLEGRMKMYNIETLSSYTSPLEGAKEILFPQTRLFGYTYSLCILSWN